MVYQAGCKLLVQCSLSLHTYALEIPPWALLNNPQFVKESPSIPEFGNFGVVSLYTHTGRLLSIQAWLVGQF